MARAPILSSIGSPYTPRQRRIGCRRQGEARQLPTRLQRAPLFLLAGRHADLRENQRGLP